jgi:arylsulfatase A-like enzyme
LSSSRGCAPVVARERSFAAGLAPVAAVVLAACSRSDDIAKASPVEPPSFELVSDDPAVRDHCPAPPRPEDVLFTDNFTVHDAARWREASTSDGAPRPSNVQWFAEGEGVHGGLMLLPGEGGVHARIEVARSDALAVTVRVRSYGHELAAQLRVADLAEKERELAADARPIAAGSDWVEARVYLDRRRGLRSVRVSLVPGDGPLLVDRVEVACLAPVERAWLVGAAADAPPHARLRVELPEMDAEMDGLLVPTGGALRWRGTLPARAPRLDVETGLLGGDRGGGAEWSVAVDGVAIATRREEVAAALWSRRFSEWTVPLDAYAGRAVTVELRCRGGRDVLGFAGAPRVLGSDATPDRARPPSVVLVSLDTLRADRVGKRPDGSTLTPRLDALAARGARFTHACSTSSWTLPAHVSIMTGQHPVVHGVLDGDRRIDARRSSLLARRFQARGYATAAFTAGAFVDPRFGFGEGFDAYSVRDPCGLARDAADSAAARDAQVDATPRRAFSWLRRHADAPFFLFLHTYFVHEYEDAAHEGKDAERCALLARATARDPAAVAELARRYDACVREVDRDFVGPLLDLLDASPLGERTIVVVVSDHGEEFLEHGGFRHGLTLHDEVGAVALLLAGPGVPRGATRTDPVSLVDVAPTLARLAGLPADARCHGRDLFAPPGPEERPLVLHLDHRCEGDVRVRGESLRLGGWRVQRMWSEAGAATLSFERDDPATGRPAPFEPTPAQCTALERRLDVELLAELARAEDARDAAKVDLPEALRERLRQLGYAGH